MRISDWSSDVCSSDLFNALESERKCRGASFFDAAHIKKRFFSQLRDVKIQAGGLCACFGHSVVPTGACSSARQASMPDSPPQAIHGLLSAYPGRDAASGDSLSMLLPATKDQEPSGTWPRTTQLPPQRR